MIYYILRRLLALLPLLLGIAFLVFFLMSLAPGDFLTPIKAQRDIAPEYIAALEKEFGLNHSWPVQFFLWLKNIATLNFGYSWTYKVPVVELLGQRLFATFLLSLSTILFSWLIAIPLGVLAAAYKDSIFDRISSFFAYAALSIPEFFLGLLAVYLAARTGWLPIGGLTSYDHDFLPWYAQICDIGIHLILPTLVLGIGNIAGIMRVMRANFLDVIRAEYVTTAKAKGLRENIILFRHVLRNAINPLITSFGFTLSGLLSGSLLVEIIMNYPGLGQLIYQSLLREDQYVVLASITLGAVMLVLGNLAADILLAWSDPRVRLEDKSS
jgi:peptide/nickel transport system permease protein